jgi:hypothetical protein
LKAEPKDHFLKPTNVFSIFGIFIPGFTACAILGLQILITKFGVECAASWNILWIITTIASFALPAFYLWYISTTYSSIKTIKRSLTIFNIFEYTFIQATLGMFFSDGKTLCYVTDGQNGIQFVFTAWLAIPILIALTYCFRMILRKRNIISSTS